MIYVHVPFCRSFCTYCGFYSELATKCRDGHVRQSGLQGRFAMALAAEIYAGRDLLAGHIAGVDGLSPKTLYVGGGTPSVMPLEFFEGMVGNLFRAGGVPRAEWDEFTVEVNPEDIVEKGEEYVQGLTALGVNRISMGVQSFDDRILRFMNRRHSAACAEKAYEILCGAGVENISIDLIFGLPQLSDSLWRDTIHRALALAPRHISAYQLSVDPGSALAKLTERGKFEEAGQEECSRQYDILCRELAVAGYNHYEISNFALPGYEAVHNSAYWSHVPYIGLGPAAHSFIVQADGESQKYSRRWNNADLNAYISAADAYFEDVRGGEILSEKELSEEKIMLALRTSRGIDAAYLRAHCEHSVIERLLKQGLLVEIPNGNRHEKSAFRIPEKHFFISDSIISDLF